MIKIESLTAIFFVAAVGTVNFTVALLCLWYAHCAQATVQVALLAVGAALLVGEVRAVNDTVTDTRRQSIVLKIANAT